MTFRFYVDDSGKADQSPVLVLAGYGASEERWAHFDQQWKTTLDKWGLDGFHMAEAWRMQHKYQKLGSIGRDALIVQLLECINLHAEFAVVNSMPFDSHEHWFAAKEFPENKSLRPYMSAFYGLMTQMYQYAFRNKFDQKIEVVFDVQGGESAEHVLGGMPEFRRLAAQGFPGLEVSTPTFRSDHDTPGLQAADIFAWLVRRDAYNLLKGVDRTRAPESLMVRQALYMPNSMKLWNEEKVRQMAVTIADAIERHLRENSGE